ncbi:MAG: PAS domain S-box protein [Candidatus Saganbacteria bacterium]|nr:PAS domain S-box protein [Candidatus Saganbacteria bacterium]
MSPLQAHINFVLLVTLAINLGLGLYIYVRSRRNIFNRVFSAILLVVSLWTLSILAFVNSTTAVDVLFWRKLTPVGPAIFTALFLYFSLIFPFRLKKSVFINIPLLLVPGIFFALLSFFTGKMVRILVVQDPFHLFLARPIFDWGYNLYTLYLVAYFLLALGILTIKLRHSSQEQRRQIAYILAGVGSTFLLGSITSLFLPLFGIVELFVFGPSFTLVMICLICYAIARYHILPVEEFLSRGIPVIGLSLALVGTAAAFWFNRPSFILPMYTVLANLTLGLMVLADNPRHEINRSFSLITFGIALWAIALYMLTGTERILLWGRLVFLGPAIIPAAFVNFSWTFPRKRFSISRLNFLVVNGAALLMIALVPTKLIVDRVIHAPSGLIPVRGPAYQLFVLYAVCFMGYGLVELVRKYRVAVGVQRSQIGYVFLGCFLSIVTSGFTNILLPLFGHVELTAFGPFFTLFLVGFITYAVIKQRLTSIEVVIQRSAVYGVATVLIMAFYAMAVMVSEIYLRRVIGYSSLLVTAMAALVIAVAYQPLVRSFQSLTDRIFFRGRYDYQKTLREISTKIAAVIRLEELSRLIVSSFIDTMKVSEISFLLLDKEQEHFRSVPISLPRYKKIEIDVGSPIISWLVASRDILVREETEDEISRQEAIGPDAGQRLKSLKEVYDEMDLLGISVWVPIISKDALIGIIALGNKLSGDEFTTEDIGLLSTLANQTAVALDNARLYNEVVNMKEYNEKILQSMVSGVLTVDIKGRIVTYNSMAEKITGRKIAEVLGRSCEELWGKRGMITNIIENTLNRGKSYNNFESNLASPERGLVPVSFSSTVLEEHDGKRMGALLTIRDLSEVKELEDKVRQADKLAALATMAAGMAHEIKNPLSSMKVLSQLLPKKMDDQEYRQKLGEILPREINRIDKIVESLLGFARATALTFERHDIAALIDENLNYFDDQAKASEIKIIKEYSDLPDIEIDKGQLSQVFSNLILNAIQAMRGGGELRIKTMPGKAVEGMLRTVKIQISDTGHGIAEETLKKLFDPFFTTKYGGTGLGLTISHSIVDGHKGYIDVASQVGKGTTFTITLPVSQSLV